MPMLQPSEQPSWSDLPIEVCMGGPLAELDRRPLRPYDPLVLDFLGKLSQSLLASLAARTHPDISTFAYWCRPAHLRRLSAKFDARHTRLGRGLALHIAPANVPVNFAFSLAFGMLAGHANVVRLPDSNHPQGPILCEALSQLLAEPAYQRLAAMNRVIRYARSDEVTRALSAQCHVRVLWGGDQTITHLRQLPIPPRCVEIAFVDRYSMCMLGADAVLQADEAALAQLAVDFYNDAYQLDQNACSSPHLVIWDGSVEAVAHAQQRFWSALAKVVAQRYTLSPVAAIDKFSQLCNVAIALPQAAACKRHGNLVYRVQLGELPEHIDRYRGRHGAFCEYRAIDLACLRTVVDEKWQTVTYFGVDRQRIVDVVVDAGLSGIDRVVPVGRALDIGVIWDGYDLIGTMSRVIGGD